MSKSIKIAPSMLAADFANLQKDVEMVNRSEADLIHIDIMDGILVPNISFGFPVCAAIHRHAKKPMDYHLMIKKPELYLEDCVKNGAEIISVHYEARPQLGDVLSEIKKLGCKPGIAINPETSVDALEKFIGDIDVVLVMSVRPGFGGQKFMPATFDKIKALRQIIDRSGSNCKIEVDGGVTLENAPELVSAGVDIIVTGSFVFNSDNPEGTIMKLKSL